MSLRILISGAGIAGPALAFWLTRFGHHCTIIERSSSLRTNGQQIDIKEQGIDVMEKMGLMDAVRKKVVEETGLRFVDANDKQKAHFPTLQSTKGRGLTSEFEIIRKDLCDILYNATKEKIEYRFGTSITDFKDTGDKVEVKFENETVEDFDLLVAADGQGSRIRKTLLGETANKEAIRHLGTGLYACYFTIPRLETDENIATAYHAPGRRLLSTRYHSPSQGQGYLWTMSRGAEITPALKQDIPTQKALFDDIFKDAGWQAERLVEAMHNADDFYAQEIIQVRSATWSRGRVVLLGDAGYAPSPITGMGTSLALVGAYVLAGEIARHGLDIPKALASYEVVLRPYVLDKQKLAPGFPGLVYPESQVGIMVLQGLLGAASAVGVGRIVEFVGRRFEGKGWVIPDLPDELRLEVIEA